MKLRVGVVGAGGIAQVHLPQITRQGSATLVGIADRDLSRARRLGRAHGIDSYDGLESLLKGARPDVVHVLVPPQGHAPVSLQAMEWGCHVLVEKPMATTVSDARQMIEVADRHGRLLCVNQNGLRHDVVRRALNLARDGQVGDVVSVEAHEVYNAERNPSFVEKGAEKRHWAYRLNGGPLQDMVPHPLSLLLEFIDEVVELHCVEMRRGVFPGGRADELRLLIRSNSVVGYIDVSVSEKPDIESFTVRGTEGILHADSYNGIVTLRRAPRLPRKVDRGLSGFLVAGQYLRGSLANIAKVATGRMDTSNGIGTVIEEFYVAIQSGGRPPVSGEQGLRVVEVIERIWPGDGPVLNPATARSGEQG